jgi:pimeloyl-ACP methyl ester carboxylesterase
MSGNQPALILLHGALGSADTMMAIETELARDFDVYMPDLPGHGARSAEQSFTSVESLVSFLNSYIEEWALVKPVVFGYSLGGYVALLHALEFPGKVQVVITFATKFHWNPEEAGKQEKMLNPAVIEIKVPAFAQLLKERHGNDHWPLVLIRTVQIMHNLGMSSLLTPDTVRDVSIPVYIAVGSDDQMVTQEESRVIAEAIPLGHFQIIDGLPHPIEKIPGVAIADLIRDCYHALIK